jgi:tetratricopeptide (TPR) repeat protein
MKRPFFLFGLSLFLVSTVTPALAQPAAPKAVDEAANVGPNSLVAHAQSAMSQRNYRDALEAIDLFLEKFADDPRVEEMLQRRAICQVKTGQPQEAIPILEKMLKVADDPARQAQLHELLGEAKAFSEDLRFFAADHFFRAGTIYHELDEAGEINAANAWSKEADLYAKYLDWRSVKSDDSETSEGVHEIRLTRMVDALDRILNLNIQEELRQSILQRKAYAIRVDRPNSEETADRMLECFQALLEINDQTGIAGETLLDAAALLIEHKRDYVAAARNYSRLLNFFPNLSKEKRVQKLLDRIIQPSFTLKTDRIFAPSEEVALNWEARNVDSVSLSVYPIELISLTRAIGHPDNLDGWEAPDDPIHHWTVKLPNPGQYRPMISGQDGVEPILFPLNKPGAYVVVGRSGMVISKRLLIVSSLASVVKNGFLETLVFVTDRRTGQPVANAEVLLQNRSGVNNFEYSTGETDENGIFRQDLSQHSPQRQSSRTGTAVIRSGDHYAVVSHGFFWRRWGYNDTHRVYGFTDRSTYLPGQRVHFKQTIRTASRDMYGNWAGRELVVTITDPAGNMIHKADLLTNQEGSASGMFTLPEKAIPGLYAITSKIGRSEFGPKESPGNQFRIITSDKVLTHEEPASEPVVIDPPSLAGDLSIRPDRDSYVPGEKARVRITSKHRTAVALVTVESDRILFARHLNLADGQANVEIPIGEDFAPNVFVKATVVENDTTHESMAEIVVPKTKEFLSVKLTAKPASPAPGGKARLHVSTKDLDGKGCPAEVTLQMVKAELFNTLPVYRNAIQDHFHGDPRPLLVQTHQQYVYFIGGLLPMASVDRPQAAKSDASPLNEQVPAGINERLLETGLWVPSVVTNDEGIAEIEINWPNQSANWRLTAIAIDHHGRAGETSTDFTMK